MLRTLVGGGSSIIQRIGRETRWEIDMGSRIYFEKLISLGLLCLSSKKFNIDILGL